MELVIGVPVALLLGLVPAPKRVRLILLALVWYVCLAAQTAWLARPERTGFGGVDGLAAVQFNPDQGSAALTYWPLQPVLALLMLGAFSLADRFRRRRTSA